MTRGVKKSDLPTKICLTCGLPFTWRKKWERNWDEVRYCSDRCRSAKAGGKGHGEPETVPLGGLPGRRPARRP